MVLALEPAIYERGLGRHPPRARLRRRRRRQRDPDPVRAHAMKVAAVETIPVSVPYRHREVSSQVARDGVSDVLVKVTTDDGLVGWGEACCGADTASVEAAVQAMTPLVARARPVEPRRDAPGRLHARPLAVPRRHRQLRLGRHRHGALGPLRPGLRPAALAPARRARSEQEATYFYYLARGTRDEPRGAGRRRPRGGLRGLLPQGRARRRGGPRAGRRPSARRSAPGRGCALDANGSWTLPAGAAQPPRAGRARHRLRRAAGARPPGRAARGGARADRRSPSARTKACGRRPTPTRGSARDRPTSTASRRTGSDRSARFHRLAWLAHYEGLQVCKHTHGELGLAAAAGQHVVPDAAERRRRAPADRVPDGARHPHRAAPDRDAGRAGERSKAPGLGVEVDEDAVAEAAARYRLEGQYVPWQDFQLAKEER